MSVPFENLTIQRFNSISWHDSKLVSLCLFEVENEDRIKLSLKILNRDGSLTPTEVIFEDCVYFQCDIYLRAKSMCSDDIGWAKCYESSDWKVAISEPSPADPILGGRAFEEHLHFTVNMCPPGGTINVLARDFSLVEVRDKSQPELSRST